MLAKEPRLRDCFKVESSSWGGVVPADQSEGQEVLSSVGVSFWISLDLPRCLLFETLIVCDRDGERDLDSGRFGLKSFINEIFLLFYKKYFIMYKI